MKSTNISCLDRFRKGSGPTAGCFYFIFILLNFKLDGRRKPERSDSVKKGDCVLEHSSVP
jgi:hypothetical protein